VYGERRGAYRVLMGEYEGKIPLGRHRCRWEDKIKMDFRKWDGDIQWIDMAQDRDRPLVLVNAVMNFEVP
jgi:hypothetical protein